MNYELFYDSEKGRLEKRWLLKSENLSDESFKEEMNLFLQKCLLLKPAYIFIDMTHLRYILDSETQKWVNNNINKPLDEANFIKKAAIILPETITEKIAIEFTFDDFTAPHRHSYFTDEKTALDWLED